MRYPWVNRPWVYWPLANLVAAAAYFALGWLVSTFFAAYGLFPAPIWLPTAVATVAAIAGQWRMYPGIFLGSFIANAALFAPALHVTAIVSLTNALGPIIGAIALRREHIERGLFTSFAGAIRFLCCTTLLSPAISAAGGTLALAIGHAPDVEHIYSTWVAWWLCDGSGTLYLAPALLLWLGLEGGATDETSEPIPFDRQYVLIWLAIAVASVVLFLSPPLRGSHIRQVFPFLLIVPLSWVALRMSLRWAYTLVSLVAVTAAAGTVAGYGPFRDQSLTNPLQLVGLLVLVLAMNVLTIVALVSELHRAQRESRDKSLFLANTSHELKTPLNAILGFSSILDQQAPAAVVDGHYSEYVRIIHSAGEHLLALINGLGDWSKIEAGQFVLHEARLPVAGVIEEAAALVRLQASAKSIALAMAAAVEPLVVYADERALRQILLNLIGNAIKYTPVGGRVEVFTETRGSGELLIGVRDTGMGIPADALPRLFAPFERFHRQIAPEIEGTGLGLCITRALVLLHGGAIAVDSKEGEGATFTVTLPATRVMPLMSATSEAAE
jgi:two-component system, cell cycle sensor histidine kinase PleC